MKVTRSTKGYYLNEIGPGGTKQVFSFIHTPSSITRLNRAMFGKDEHALLYVLILRSAYLDKIIPCLETKNAVSALIEATLSLERLMQKVTGKEAVGFWVKETREGHTYVIAGPGNITRTLNFICRSGGAVTYPEEWPGIQSQEVMRMLIARFKKLGKCLGDSSVESCLFFTRLALVEYEMRALRRKAEGVNRQVSEHQEAERHKPWRTQQFELDSIEKMPTGTDGHVITKSR